MRSPYRSSSRLAYTFGPGPATSVVKALIIANVVMFVASQLSMLVPLYLGLVPAQVVGSGRVWQLLTYQFLHGSIFHILFNMLSLWMFGVELERMWGSRFFLTFYLVTGVGAGLTQIIASLVPVDALSSLYYAQTIGASGAIYGLLMAYAMYFPNRQIMFWGVFPILVKYFVLIMGGISLISAADGAGGVAHMAHLGGMLFGYLYLKRRRFHPLAELKYRYTRWRINRSRRRFDVYSGGRSNDRNTRIH